MRAADLPKTAQTRKFIMPTFDWTSAPESVPRKRSRNADPEENAPAVRAPTDGAAYYYLGEYLEAEVALALRKAVGALKACSR
jgi:hypothetical protein